MTLTLASIPTMSQIQVGTDEYATLKEHLSGELAACHRDVELFGGTVSNTQAAVNILDIKAHACGFEMGAAS